MEYESKCTKQSKAYTKCWLEASETEMSTAARINEL